MRLILTLLAISLTTHAAEMCPWMNAATAGGFLGAPVTVSVTHENNNRDDTVCTFQGGGHELRIDVQTMDTPRSDYKLQAAQCSVNAASLKAVGNEAVLCGPEQGDASKRTVRVVGRVRTRIFTIAVSTTAAALEPAVLREKARSIAEQIAGVLF